MSRIVGFGAAVVVIVVIALIAFGSSSNNSVDPLAKAATLSTNAPGFKMVMTMDVGTASEPNILTGVGNGSFDTRGHSGSMSMVMKVATEVGTTKSIAINEILDGGNIFMQLPASLDGSLGVVGKKWIEINLSKASGIPGLSSLASGGAADNPGEMLQYLKAASSGVTNLGHQVIDGIETTGYKGTIQISKVPGAVPPSERAAAKAAMNKITQEAHISAIPMTVWIDKKQLVRRMALAITASADGQTLDETITISMPEYGPQSAPTLPSAGEVAPVSSLGSS
jgi:hypothetical protein